MRELTIEEMDQVDGGIAPFAIALAVGAGVVIGGRNGGVPGALVGGILAVPTALFGGIAVAAAGAGRAMFSVYSIGTGLLANEASRHIGQGNGS